MSNAIINLRKNIQERKRIESEIINRIVSNARFLSNHDAIKIIYPQYEEKSFSDIQVWGIDDELTDILRVARRIAKNPASDIMEIVDNGDNVTLITTSNLRGYKVPLIMGLEEEELYWEIKPFYLQEDRLNPTGPTIGEMENDLQSLKEEIENIAILQRNNEIDIFSFSSKYVELSQKVEDIQNEIEELDRHFQECKWVFEDD